MKRKLDRNDVPSPGASEPVEAPNSTFESLNLDNRLLQAISKEKYVNPTPVQAKAIPLALEGKDILARARTGSGKTAVYVLSVLQSLLSSKSNSHLDKAVSALVLVPTKELAQQVHKSFSTFSAYCSKEARSVNLTQPVSDTVLRSLLVDTPDIVISTPSRACQMLNTNALSLRNLGQLVIDEADLVLSYGYENDMKSIAKHIPSGVQTFLMSATLTTEVDTLRGVFCKNPAILKLEEKEDEGGGNPQYTVKCAEDEKFLLTYVIFKLRLIKGKCLIFVGGIDRSYRLKLFLEQFGIKSCVLNSELPLNSRIHVVQEFNKGIYDIVIAADDQEILKGVLKQKNSPTANDNVEGGYGSESETDTAQARKRRKTVDKDRDYGISRGIDFQNIACVLNFDLPTTSKAYTHRIGRTARAGKTGMALSFVIPKEQYGKHRPTSFAPSKHDERVLDKIVRRQAKMGKEVKPYHFDMPQVDVFRYRMNDALGAVTRASIREVRTREIKQELLKSEKLKRHFDENPEDLRHLRHDNELRATRSQAHLKHVPDYLMPEKSRKSLTSEEVGFVGVRKSSKNRTRKAGMHKRNKGKGHGAVRRKVDPLKSFKAKDRL